MGIGTPDRSSGDPESTREGSGRKRAEVGDTSYGYRCLTGNCPAARDYGAAKIRSEVEAARHRRRFPHHVVALAETRVYAVFGENTPPLIENGCADEPPF